MEIYNGGSKKGGRLTRDRGTYKVIALAQLSSPVCTRTNRKFIHNVARFNAMKHGHMLRSKVPDRFELRLTSLYARPQARGHLELSRATEWDNQGAS